MGRIDPARLPPATWAPSDALWVLRLLRRNWAVLLLSGFAGLLALMAVMVIMGPRYDVSAKVVVQLGRETSASPAISARPGAPVMPAALRPEDIASEVELLRDPALIRSVVNDLGEDFFLAEPPASTLFQRIKQVPKAMWRGVRAGIDAVLAMTGLRPPISPLDRVMVAIGAGMSVENIRKSDVIEIKLGFPDPQAGILFLQKYLDAALDSHIKTNRPGSALTFFASERDTRAAELRDAERRLLAIRADPAATWSSPEQRSALMKAEADLDLQILQLVGDAAQSGAEIARNRAMLATQAPEVTLSTVRARNKAGDDLRARILQLQVDLATLRSRYAEGSPELADMQRQIGALTASRDQEPEYQVQEVTSGASQRYEALAREVSARESQLAPVSPDAKLASPIETVMLSLPLPVSISSSASDCRTRSARCSALCSDESGITTTNSSPP